MSWMIWLLKKPIFYAVIAVLVVACGSASSSSAGAPAPTRSPVAATSPAIPSTSAAPISSPKLTHRADARPSLSATPTSSATSTHPAISTTPTQAVQMTPIEQALANGYSGVWTRKGQGITLTIPPDSATGTLVAGDTIVTMTFSLVNGRTIVPLVQTVSPVPNTTGIQPGVTGFLYIVLLREV